MAKLRDPSLRSPFADRLRHLRTEIDNLKSLAAGPQPRASQRLRTGFLNVHADVESSIVQYLVDAPDNPVSGIYRSLLEDAVPVADIYRAVDSESRRMLAYLERVEAELAKTEATAVGSQSRQPQPASGGSAGDAPRVFVSHSNADKERFVLKFAERLRANGVNAWLDRWEILPGDSLIDLIFAEGIGQAAAVVVVLSDNSIRSRWVAEELNAATVRRINGQSRLIVIRLDRVEVPPALSDSLYVDIDPLEDWEPQLNDVLKGVFGVRVRPPLGAAPDFLTAAEAT